MADVVTVANRIILLHREKFGESPSHMKVQKLCYYAQGFSLAKGFDLIEQDFQAWKHGPVVPELFKNLTAYGWKPLDFNIDAFVLPNEDQLPLEYVVESFGSYDAGALRRMTHDEPPWINARGGIPETENCENTITKDSIRAYFTQLIAQA